MLATLFTIAALSAPTTDICRAMGDMAEGIMDARQTGVPMSDVMGLPGAPGPMADLWRATTIAAYDTPRYHTDRSQTRAVEDFRNEVEVRCYVLDRP